MKTGETAQRVNENDLKSCNMLDERHAISQTSFRRCTFVNRVRVPNLTILAKVQGYKANSKTYMVNNML